MLEFLSYLISGISLGSVYAIIALGYTMVYGIAKMLNFAHGDVIMVGAYIIFCAAQYWNLPPVVSILLAMAVCTALGITIERFAYKPLRKATSLAVLITAIVTLANGKLIIALILTMLCCIVLGMGVPTTANYIMMSMITVPAATFSPGATDCATTL